MLFSCRVCDLTYVKFDNNILSTDPYMGRCGGQFQTAYFEDFLNMCYVIVKITALV